MKFKEIFDKEIIIESHIRKNLKIFYEINLKLVKPKEEKKEESTQEQPKNEPEQQLNNPEPISNPEPAEAQIPATQAPASQEIPQSSGFEDALASVVTEEEDEEITRKEEGEVELTPSQKDNIQSFEDIIDILSKIKKEGKELLDEFSSEVVTLCASQNFNEIKNKVDKSSRIFIEFYFGYKKDDSIGVRFSKRENSDTLTSTMLVDNEIVSAKFSIDKVNQKIIEYRNYEANKIK